MEDLKRVDTGLAVPDIYREPVISTATFYKWRSKYGGMDTSTMARMKVLETENARLTKMYIEEKLNVKIVTEALAKKWWDQSRRREMAKQVVQDKGTSIRLACQAFAVTETCYR